MPKPAMKELSDAEAAAELGLPMTEEEVATVTKPVQKQEEPKQRQTEPPAQPVGTVSTEPVVEPSEQNQLTNQEEQEQPKLTEEERRRQWQSKADQAVAEAKRLAQENEILRQIALQNKVIQQSISSQQPSVPPVQTPKEPMLADYVDDDYDPTDAFDGRTKSGRQYQQYMKDRENYILSLAEQRAEQRVFGKLQQEKQQSLLLQRAQRLVEKYPQFKDPLTGQPDFERIKQELFDSATDDPDDWVTLANIRLRGKTQTNVPVRNQSADVIEQIERNAQQPRSVVSSPPVTPMKPQELSDEDKAMIAVFGDNWKVPIPE